MGSQGQSGARKDAVSDGTLLPSERSSPKETTFSGATRGDLQAVRALLRSCDLPIEDLAPRALRPLPIARCRVSRHLGTQWHLYAAHPRRRSPTPRLPILTFDRM